MSKLVTALTLLFVLFFTTMCAATKEDISLTDKDTIKHVFILPKKDNESQYEIKFIIGKTLLVDCNRHSLVGDIHNKSINEYSYTVIEIEIEKNILISTRMGCPKPKTKRFITLRTQRHFTPYNSKIPLVIYAPKDIEVSYKTIKKITSN